jgi:hypothetical protein
MGAALYGHLEIVRCASPRWDEEGNQKKDQGYGDQEEDWDCDFQGD